MLKLLLSLALVATLSGVALANSKIVYCYYGTWATYRSGDGKFSTEDIDVNLCTHVVYTFAGINGDGTIKFLDPWLDLNSTEGGGRDNLRKFVALKEKNPKLKTLLAIGGWNQGSAIFSTVANDAALRKIFVQNATQICVDFGFDGFDLDWEYPNRRDTVYGNADINNFSKLLGELREAFDKNGFLLTAAVASVADKAVLSYKVEDICKSLDFVNLMTYDMTVASDNHTGHNSPLYKGLGDEDISRLDAYTVDAAVTYWIEKGCPKEKLLVGIPFYGHSFYLADADNSAVRAPVSGPGIAGQYTVENGTIAYNEFCTQLKDGSWDLRYDDLAKVPYAVQGNQWVSYDDPNSVTAKVNYAVQTGVAGIMVWSLESDDFKGKCNSETFPLLKSINRALGRKW